MLGTQALTCTVFRSCLPTSKRLTYLTLNLRKTIKLKPQNILAHQPNSNLAS